MICELLGLLVFCKLVYPLLRILFVYTLGKKLFSHRKALHLAGEWAIVTGASYGIGKAYACELAKEGLKIFLLGNQAQELDEAAEEISGRFQVETKTMVVDFTRTDIYEEIEAAVKKLPSIACLVNNVGIFYPEHLPPWPESSLVSSEFIQKLLTCNMITTASLTRIVLPRMLTQHQRGAAIINLSSASALFPFPYFSLYASSKAFILAFSEALRNEVGNNALVIQAVCPSLVATRMTKQRPSLMVPDPDRYVQSALDMLGVESVTSGYIYHALRLPLTLLSPVSLVKKRALRGVQLRMKTAGE